MVRCAHYSGTTGASREREDKRFERRPLVDPGAEGRAEGDGTDRSRGQDDAQRQGAEASLFDEKEYDVGERDRIGEANEDVDDDERDEERRAVGVRGQRSLVVTTNDAQGFSIGSESSD